MADVVRRFVVPERVKLHIAMLALQFGYAGFHIVSRAALDMGISKIVFPIYRNIIALLLLGPAAYFFEKKERPPLTLSFLVQFFLLALCGITANQGFYLLGLYYTTPTFASAIQNSVPAITFIMAAILGMEEVHIRRLDGMAKIVGTVACVGGATIITLYKGPPITKFWLGSLNSGSLNPELYDVEPLGMKSENWTLGCIYLLGNCLAWSGWIVIQAPVLKKYPARLSVTSFTCLFGIMQFLAIAAFFFYEISVLRYREIILCYQTTTMSTKKSGAKTAGSNGSAGKSGGASKGSLGKSAPKPSSQVMSAGKPRVKGSLGKGNLSGVKLQDAAADIKAGKLDSSSNAPLPVQKGQKGGCSQGQKAGCNQGQKAVCNQGEDE